VTPPLFLVDELPSGDALRLTGDEGRHAARVKRIGIGESVLVSDGRGALLDCTVTAVEADGLVLAVRQRHDIPAARPRIVAVQALPKGERAELAVEMLTELGVDEIVPWAASRSVAQWHGSRGDKALDKWRRTAREAAKQSRRAWVPIISPLASTDDVVDLLSGGVGLVLHEDAVEPLGSVPLAAVDDVMIVVGPEGGIAPGELEAFIAAGARAVRLGDPVLRTSTAGAAALAVLSLRLGRWSHERTV
jgi:16S rRNA (uracil1498-N3)-methyltransferase